MKYIAACICGGFMMMTLVTHARAADIKVVSTSFDVSYSAATSYNDNFKSKDSIDHAENYGFGMEIKIGLSPVVRFTVGFNYTPMKVSEYDPVLALMRTSAPPEFKRAFWYYTNHNYIERTSADGQRQIFDVAYDYQYHMYYINVPLGIDISPIQTGIFQPFIGAGISLAKFEQRGYWVTDITGRMEDANNNFLQKVHYRIRAHNMANNQHRGYFLNGYLSGGIDLMFNKNFGLQIKGRYVHTIKDNKRNRITGFYNINTSLVFRP